MYNHANGKVLAYTSLQLKEYEKHYRFHDLGVIAAVFALDFLGIICMNTQTIRI